MPCQNCGGSTIINNAPTSNCPQVNPAPCIDMVNTSCEIYDGPDLPNMDIVSGQPMNDIFPAIDAKFVQGIFADPIVIPASAILSIDSVYYNLTAVPGSGKLIKLLGAAFKVNDDATIPYVIPAHNFIIKTLNSTNPLMTCPLTGLTSLNSVSINNFIFTSNTTATGVVNDQLILTLDNTATPITTGNGSITVYIIYIIISA